MGDPAATGGGVRPLADSGGASAVCSYFGFLSRCSTCTVNCTADGRDGAAADVQLAFGAIE